MSYDIRIWSVLEPAWNDILSLDDGWHRENNSYVFSTTNWQIIVGRPVSVEDEDIPDEVIDKLPGIQYLSEIILEPISAPKSAHSTLRTLVNRISKEFLAVVEDPQQDSIVTPRGIHKVTQKSSEENVSVFELGWWFNESPLLQKDGFAPTPLSHGKISPRSAPQALWAIRTTAISLRARGQRPFHRVSLK